MPLAAVERPVSFARATPSATLVASGLARGLVAAGVAWFAIGAAPIGERLAPALADGRAILAAHGPLLTLGPAAFAAPDAATAALGWLGALVTAALAAAGGGGAVATATAVALVVTLGLIEWRARRRAGSLAAFAATALALGTFGAALRVGGGASDWVCVALLLALLDAPRPRVAAIAMLAVAWCNLSAAGVLAPALVGLVAAGAALDGDAARARALRRIFFIACAATFATPALWSYVPHAFAALRVERWVVPLVAVHPADVAAAAYRTGFAALLLVAALAGARRASDALPALAACALAFANGAFLPLAGIVVAPLLAETAFARLPRAALALAAMAACAAAFGAASNVPRVDAVSASPAAAIARALAAPDAPRRIVCVPIDWCGLARAASARTSVLMDGRVDAFPAAVVADQLAVQRASSGYEAVLRRNAVDGAILRPTDALVTLLELRGWRERLRDERAIVLARTSAP